MFPQLALTFKPAFNLICKHTELMPWPSKLPTLVVVVHKVVRWVFWINFDAESCVVIQAFPEYSVHVPGVLFKCLLLESITCQWFSLPLVFQVDLKISLLTYNKKNSSFGICELSHCIKLNFLTFWFWTSLSLVILSHFSKFFGHEKQKRIIVIIQHK